MAGPPPLPADLADRDDAPRRRSPWRVPLIVLGVVLGLILLLVGVAVLFALLAKEVPVTDADKAVVLTAHELAAWFEDLTPDPALETWTKTRHIDGTHELEYEYDGDDLYVSVSIGVDESASDARISYTALTAGVAIGTAFEDAEWRTRNDLMTWGDRSKSALLIVEGDAPAGNLFACQKGKRTILIVFSGVYFDEPGPLRELLEPALERWARYTP